MQHDEGAEMRQGLVKKSFTKRKKNREKTSYQALISPLGSISSKQDMHW